MTAQHLIELVLEQSPLDNPSIAKLHLSNALDYFCEKTLILRRRTSITLSSENLRHSITDPDDIIHIRNLSYEGVDLEHTTFPESLAENNGFWYVEANTPLTLHLGQWSRGKEVPFAANSELDMIYEAYAQKFATDSDGNEDFSVAPEIPKRFHEALTYRACEKANVVHPEMRSYWHALWRDELTKGRQHANQMNANTTISPKIYTL